MRKGYIYGARCICHPEDGVRYVGQTVVSVQSRISVHFWNAEKTESKSYRSHFSNWIRKHGKENVVFFVTEETTEREIDDREEHWIQLFRSEGAKLTNIKAGGKQARGHKRPQHAKSMSGENNPMWGKDRKELMDYARSFQGPPTEETRRKWSEQRRGEGNVRAKLTEEDVRRIRREPKKRGMLSRLAREYGVTPQSIWAAYNGKTWTHLEDETGRG